MHNINLDTNIYESPDFVDSEDKTYSNINTQKTGTNIKQWMLIVTLLVLFVLDGLQIAFIVFNKASHEKHVGRILI